MNPALLAAELLAGISGEESLLGYWDALKPGTTWQKEFKNTFGTPIEEFYELFEKHRAAGFPEVEIPKSVGE